VTRSQACSSAGGSVIRTTFPRATGGQEHRWISDRKPHGTQHTGTPQELLALNAESAKPQPSEKLMEAQNTITGLKLGPIEELDLLLGLVRRQTDWHHFVMTELLEDPEPVGEAVALWSADLQRLEQSLSLLTSVRFGE